MKKSIYSATQAIIERMKQSEGKVSKSQLRTANYLRKLDKTPDADVLEYMGLRYRG